MLALLRVLLLGNFYLAYAPEPIVLETKRNGTSTGRGASCECDTPFITPLVGTSRQNPTSVKLPTVAS
jgi:hypothetical protein